MVRNSPRSHDVITVNTTVLIRHDKRAGGTAQLVGHYATLEPIVKNDLATVKSIEYAGGCEWQRCVELQSHGLTVVHGGVTSMRRPSPAL